MVHDDEIETRVRAFTTSLYTAMEKDRATRESLTQNIHGLREYLAMLAHIFRSCRTALLTDGGHAVRVKELVLSGSPSGKVARPSWL